MVSATTLKNTASYTIRSLSTAHRVGRTLSQYRTPRSLRVGPLVPFWTRGRSVGCSVRAGSCPDTPLQYHTPHRIRWYDGSVPHTA
eukprot:3940630-Rhodomonas_salina.2